jgi:hypothetical protein
VVHQQPGEHTVHAHGRPARGGEVEELRLEDLDLPGKQLTVRFGKGLKDRTVFMTETTTKAVQEYLAVRGIGPTDHVFLYRNQPLSKDLISGRLKIVGQSVGVKVFPHRLRHTCVTQLLNAGCRITSIQKFLGHKRLNTTLTYARAHDQTVAEDYYTAMSSVERRLDLGDKLKRQTKNIQADVREQLLLLTEALTETFISLENRLDIVTSILGLLKGDGIVFQKRILEKSPPM